MGFVETLVLVDAFVTGLHVWIGTTMTQEIAIVCGTCVQWIADTNTVKVAVQIDTNLMGRAVIQVEGALVLVDADLAASLVSRAASTVVTGFAIGEDWGTRSKWVAIMNILGTDTKGIVLETTAV
jgi:hypothetical protein